MPETLAPLNWTETGDHGFVAEVPGGRLYLETLHGTAKIGFQLDRPAALTAADVEAQRRRRSDNRRAYELAAMAPGRSENGGYVRDAALAKTLIDDAQCRESGLRVDRLLANANYRIKTTNVFNGLSWQRHTKERTDEIVVSPERVYTIVWPRGMGRPKYPLDLSLRRIGSRSEHPYTIHQIWPAFMDDIGALTAMAIQAVDLTP